MGLTFGQLFGTGGREFDRQKSKNSNARAVARGGGRGEGGGMLRLQIDRCIISNNCSVLHGWSIVSVRYFDYKKLVTRMSDNEAGTSASASIVDVPTIPPFFVDDHNTLSQRWVKWKKSFAYYVDASGVKDDKQKRALLLHLARPGVQEIFETLEDTGDGVGKTDCVF